MLFRRVVGESFFGKSILSFMIEFCFKSTHRCFIPATQCSFFNPLLSL